MISLHHPSYSEGGRGQAYEELARQGLAKLLGRGDLGFHQLPDRRELWDQAELHGQRLRETSSHLAILGIGGSSLGVRALVEALNPGDWSERITIFDNVDPIHNGRRLQQLKSKLDKVHWVVISKSGNTIETLCMADFVLQMLRQRALSAKGRFTVVSEEKESPLTDWARANDVPVLPIPLDVGGRFSVLTPVGTLPAAFLGLNISKMRQGALWARSQSALITTLVAESMAGFKEEKWITLFWSYTDLLYVTGLWYQQLWSESLGKAVDRRGAAAPRVSSPFACIGASDQHSILQQVMEGARDKTIWFLRSRQVEAGRERLESTAFRGQEILVGKTMGDLLAAEADATRDALAQQGVPSLTLTLDEVHEGSLSALFMLLELVVGSLGEALNIDAFNQPGVELGKRLARAKLKK